MSDLNYFKPGESVSVAAAVNGFIVYTEQGEFLASNPSEMLKLVLNATTNNDEFVAQQRAIEAAKTAEAEVEAEVGVGGDTPNQDITEAATP